MRLREQVAIVTGGGQGMGRGIALRLAREGADVALFDVKVDEMEGVAEEIRALGRVARTYEVDVSSVDAVDQAVGAVVREFGDLHVLVNNAGIGQHCRFLEQTPDDWLRIYAVNVFGLTYCCRAALRHMTERGRGNIVNISSTAGKQGPPYSTHYGSSKAAVISTTQSLAMEFARSGIRVNAVCPGFLLTDHWEQRSGQLAAIRGVTPEKVIADRIAKIPLGRAQTPEDVAAVVAFLASEDSDAMTGQAVNVTGGVELR